jgi:uncharacterized protein YndB with AHSA1/START domain
MGEGIRPEIDKSVFVECDLDTAFRVWVEEIASWWPVDPASWSGDGAIVAIEGHLGGRVFETARDGNVYVWGRVVEWDPPHRFVYSYDPCGAGDVTRVEVTFSTEHDGTRVRVRHSGWENVPREVMVARLPDYDEGAHVLLERYRLYTVDVPRRVTGGTEAAELLSVAPVWLVSDVVASCEELRELFGFEIRPYFAPESEGAIYGIVEHAWVRIHLSRAPDGVARPGRPYKREHCDAYLFVADVDELHDRLLGRGANVLQRPRAMPYPIKEMHVGLRDGFVLACGQPLAPAVA